MPRIILTVVHPITHLVSLPVANNKRPQLFTDNLALGGRLSTDAKWDAAYERARALVSQMTIPEKVNLTTGTGFMSEACVGNTGSVPRLNITSLCLQDSPLGVRADLASNFPPAIAAGATFNKPLISYRGNAIAAEHKRKGVHVVLGPAIGPLGRNPAGGRNWEGFGADPYLQGIGSRLTVRSIQNAGLVATAKHFIGNEQEHFRQVIESVGYGYSNIQASISSNIDDRTLHEIYLWPFADAIHEGVGSVMCSYNQVNNSYACQNSYLINKVLKEELGFQGFVMSDWWATHSGVAPANAGTDMTMPGDAGWELWGRTFWGPNLVTATLNGSVADWRLNDMAVRIMAAYYYVGLDKNTIGGPNYFAWTKQTTGLLHPLSWNSPEGVVNKHVNVMHSPISKMASIQTAREAIVLLKNSNQTLPFYTPQNSAKTHPRSINIFGLAAGPDPNGANCADGIGCSNGALGSGWGSGSVFFPYFVTPYEGISERARQNDIEVDYAFSSWDLDRVYKKAPNADFNLIFGLSDSGEGFIQVDHNLGDRNNFTLWHNAENVIAETVKLNRNNIIIVTSVGAVNMEKWIDHENVTAVIFTPPAGQDAGTALADVIWGVQNACGKLPFTIAKNDTDYIPILEQLPSDGYPQANFQEGIYIDYRNFDAKNIQPRFEFGYGLSYSNWTVSNGKVIPILPINSSDLPPSPNWKDLGSSSCTASSSSDPHSLLFPQNFNNMSNYIYPYLNTLEGVPQSLNTTCSIQQGAPLHPPLAGGGLGGNPALWEVVYQVSATVTNHGPYVGSYAFQLYLGFPTDTYDSPPRQLRGFEKPNLGINNSATLSFPLLRRDISVWDTVKQSWVVPKGTYKVYVGYSSRDIAWTGSFVV